MQHWLMKSEPDAYGLEHLRRDGRTSWEGVRNFQARNHMIAMRLGDEAFFYHSSTKVPAVVGVIRVAAEAHPDASARDPKSPYYDERSTFEKPIWKCVDVEFVRELARPVTLAEIRAEPDLADMQLVQRGSRLSVQPVTAAEWKRILEMSRTPRG